VLQSSDDLSDVLAGLAGLGAEVALVEPAGGSFSRRTRLVEVRQEGAVSDLAVPGGGLEAAAGRMPMPVNLEVVRQDRLPRKVPVLVEQEVEVPCHGADDGIGGSDVAGAVDHMSHPHVPRDCKSVRPGEGFVEPVDLVGLGSVRLTTEREPSSTVLRSIWSWSLWTGTPWTILAFGSMSFRRSLGPRSPRIARSEMSLIQGKRRARERRSPLLVTVVIPPKSDRV